MADFVGKDTGAFVGSLIQAALLVTLFSSDAFTFMLKLCSSLSLIPYLLAAAYALKLGVSGETYETAPRSRNKALFVAGLATFYTVFLVFAAGVTFLLLSLIIYTPGTVLFIMSRREQKPAALLCRRASHPRHRRGWLHRRDRSPGGRRNHHLGEPK